MEECLEASINYYNNWVEDVKRTVPKDRLLIFRVQEGWEPLCKFLGKLIPNEPFPHVNDKNAIKTMGYKQKIMAWSLAGMAKSQIITFCNIRYLIPKSILTQSYYTFRCCGILPSWQTKGSPFLRHQHSEHYEQS